MVILAGLGNPGRQYAGNRHNVGFMAIDRIVAHHGLQGPRDKFQAKLFEGEIGGQKVIALKPQTFMNESGQAVGAAERFYKVPPDQVVVFYDELDLAPGKLRVKAGGGAAGHNGIRSIDAHIGNAFRRVRIGIGHPGRKDLVHNWVLSDFAKADAEWRDRLLDACAQHAGKLVDGDDARFMNAVALTMQSITGEPKPAASRKQPAEKKPKQAGDPPSATSKADEADASTQTAAPSGSVFGVLKRLIRDNR